MAKNSHARIGMAGAVLALALPVCTATAGGLPLRAAAPAQQDRALAGLAEGLDFKLSRFDKAAPVGQAAWDAMVEETLLVAARLGCPAGQRVTAQHSGKIYAVVLEGDSVLAGADPDQVLGRLLYTLAHADAENHSAAALAVLDQPLSATLAALPLTSSP